MHPAKPFHVDDRETLLAFIRAHPFVTIAAAVRGRPFVAQAPVVIRELDFGEVALDFHLSRGNLLSPHIVQGFRAVILATGPDAYVSPDWTPAPIRSEPGTTCRSRPRGRSRRSMTTNSWPCSTTSRPRRRRVCCPSRPGPATR